MGHMQTSLSRCIRRNSISLEKSLHFLTGAKSLPGSCSVSGVCTLSGGILSPILRLGAQYHLLSLFWSLWISWALPGSATSWAGGPCLQCCCTVVGLFCGWRPWKQNPRRRHLRTTQQPCLRGWSKAEVALFCLAHLLSVLQKCEGSFWPSMPLPLPLSLWDCPFFYFFSVLLMGCQEEEEVKVWWAVAVNLNLKQGDHTVNGDVILPPNAWHG